jgi:hypothetical protein
MKFCTAINCMDGRVQIPVLNHMREKYGAEYVDTITEPGPNGIIAEGMDVTRVESILKRIDISVHRHESRAMCIVGHHDCAGNPVPKDRQIVQVRKAMKFLKGKYPDVEVIGLWVDENWNPTEIAP